MKVVSFNVDFFIVGGGLAGVSAAIAAARQGASVVLVQDRPVLGGNASSEIKMHVVGADCHGHRPGARESGFIEELRLEDATRNPHRSYSLWDLLLYEKVIEEPNIRLLLNATFVDCTVNHRREIESVRVVRYSTEESFEITARFFADCSGDGCLGAAAGADFRVGRESRQEYGESKALPEADKKTLGNSILFTARRQNGPSVFHTPGWIRKFQKEDFVLRPIQGYDYGYWWAEWGGQLDTIRDNDHIRHELLRITLGIWDYIKNSGEYPDAENWALDWVGSVPGKRESRRFLGPHILTQTDIESGRSFPDQVAYGGWWLDLHPPEGIDAPTEEPCVQHHFPHLYGIPLSCLYSRNIANLFFAGRNISATHVAFASTRVMGTCAVMGQAIGTAAGLWRTETPAIAELTSPARVREVQQTLLRNDAFLLGITNEDVCDLAKKAGVSASSEEKGYPAAMVATGPSRKTVAAWGPWATDSGNHWQSIGLPARLTLNWGEAQELSEIELTFCTGMDRELMLTPSAHLTSKMTRSAQPETVKDYNLLIDGRIVLEVRGNYLRKRRHLLSPKAQGRSLTVEVLATNGFEHARIYEIRAYAEPSLLAHA